MIVSYDLSGVGWMRKVQDGKLHEAAVSSVQSGSEGEYNFLLLWLESVYKMYVLMMAMSNSGEGFSPSLESSLENP